VKRSNLTERNWLLKWKIFFDTQIIPLTIYETGLSAVFGWRRNPHLPSSLFTKTKQWRTDYSFLKNLLLLACNFCQGQTFARDFFFPLVRSLDKYLWLFSPLGRISAWPETLPSELALKHNISKLKLEEFSPLSCFI